jgi:hypothetical protein
MTDAAPAPAPQGLMLMIEWGVLPAETQRAIIDALSKHANYKASDAEVTETESYPLNILQARQLIDGVDDKTKEFLRALVKNFDKNAFVEWENYAWLSYPDAWKIAGVTDKSEFARGSLSGIHRRLRKITNDASAGLIFSADDGGLQEEGSYYIDNWAAVSALREAFKPKQPSKLTND